MTSLTSGCVADGSRVVTSTCPPVVAYPAKEQAVVADHLKLLPPGSPVREWIKDYGVMREQARDCAKPL